MDTDAYDRYAPLLSLCGITAFRLPPPFSGPRPVDDRRINLFGPIPDHLLGQYLCFNPSPPPPAAAATSLEDYSSPSIRDSPPPPSLTDPRSSEPLLHDSPLSCHVSNRDSSSSDPRHTDLPEGDVVHELESLPLCVVNYQVSLHSTPEGEGCSYSASVGVGDSYDERKIHILLLSEIKELALWHEDDVLEDYDIKHMVSVMTTFKNLVFALGYGERLLSRIKKLALWNEDVVLDGNDIKNMVSVMTSFRNIAFFIESRKNSWYESDSQEPSRKNQRKSEAISNSVSTSAHFTRSKLANFNEADYCVVDLDDYLSKKRKLKRKEKKKSQVDRNANLSSGCSELVDKDSHLSN